MVGEAKVGSDGMVDAAIMDNIDDNGAGIGKGCAVGVPNKDRIDDIYAVVGMTGEVVGIDDGGTVRAATRLVCSHGRCRAWGWGSAIGAACCRCRSQSSTVDTPRVWGPW